MNDGEILRKMRSGDASALEKLMDRYIPYVSTVVWNVLRQRMTREDAEEVVSDVFVIAWNQAEEIRPETVKAWLGAVARNKAKNALRKAKLELPLEDDLLEIPGAETLDERMERQQERQLVQSAIDELGHPDREVFLRYYYYAQTIAEIAWQMNLNQSTVKTKLRRGRFRLKEMLTRWDVG